MTLEKALSYAMTALMAHQRTIIQNPNLAEEHKTAGVLRTTEAIAKIAAMELLVKGERDE